MTEDKFFQKLSTTSYKERLIFGYMLGSIAGLWYYASFAIEQYKLGAFELMTIPSIWGTRFLVIIGIQIIASIVLSIIASIIHAIITREEDFGDDDERDKQIDMRANNISYILFSIGFVIAVITLSLGMSPLVMFNIIVFSLLLSGIIGFIVQLRIYKRGF